VDIQEAVPSSAVLGRELRCECGSLVAKLVGDRIELKCRRCKRLALIPLGRLGEQPVEIHLR
jgi:phage FluMu protein Com